MKNLFKNIPVLLLLIFYSILIIPNYYIFTETFCHSGDIILALIGGNALVFVCSFIVIAWCHDFNIKRHNQFFEIHNKLYLSIKNFIKTFLSIN